MTEAVQHAEFIGERTARLFLMSYAPASGAIPTACYVVAPAFAEEMNRSRDALRALGLEAARHGAALMIPDLRGTGDSDGAFGDYTIDDWCADVHQVVALARERYPDAAVHLVGVRFGALIAARVAHAAGVNQLLLWQPVTEGRKQVREFLRIWSAANMDASEDARALLNRDGALEVAGYRVTPELIDTLEQLTFDVAEAPTITIRWLEAGASVSARSERVANTLREAGHTVATHTVDSPPFWRVQERVDAAAFARASIAELAEATVDG